MSQEQKFFDVEVDEVHSGDDLILMVNLGVDNLFKKVRARLRGVDTPSAFKAGKDTEAGEVRDTLKAITSRGKCSIELHSQGKGGWLITLYVHTTDSKVTNVNDLLISRGYVYQGRLQESK